MIGAENDSANRRNVKSMTKDINSPRYGDVVSFTCFFYPMISTGCRMLECNDGASSIVGTLMFCVLIYLPFASLAFVCIRKKMKRIHAFIVSTFVGLIALHVTYCIIAYGLLGPSIGWQGVVLGLISLGIPYILCICFYLILYKYITKINN